jgi:prepilin-type N-terminal cleavage/methylation domain-containing protein
MGRARKIRRNQAGLTLIELVIVVSLLGLMVAITVPSVSNITGFNLKAAASQVGGTIRYTYDLAARKNSTFRIVFDLDEQAYWVESASDKFLLKSDKTDVRDGELEVEDEEEEERSRRFVSRSFIEGGEMWHPKSRTTFSSFAGKLTEKMKLPNEVVFQDVWVAHQSDRVTIGQAYLYCFPTGMTEQAVIHMGDGDEDVYTLQVEGLLGSVKIDSHYVEGPEE